MIDKEKILKEAKELTYKHKQNTMSERYCGRDEEEYGAYWILDISNCSKTKEDFLDENKEIYDIYAWEDYLRKCGKLLTKKEVVYLLNENEHLKNELKDCHKSNHQYYVERNKLIHLCEEFNINWRRELEND